MIAMLLASTLFIFAPMILILIVALLFSVFVLAPMGLIATAQSFGILILMALAIPPVAITLFVGWLGGVGIITGFGALFEWLAGLDWLVEWVRGLLGYEVLETIGALFGI